MNLSVIDKSYDIRGIYPTDIDETMYYQLGFGFASLLTDVATIAVGCDSRLSGPALKSAFIEGVRDAGKNIVDVGLCSTDMIYFSSGYYKDIDAAVMITASHNPKEYNGLKSCLRNAVPLNMKDFGKTLRAYLEAGEFEKAAMRGNHEVRDISLDFVDHVASFVTRTPVNPLTVVADAGNGVAGIFMEKLAKKLGFNLIPMFFEPDGNFPNHHPSPIEPENVEDMIHKVKESGADLGVAFDGDADRMYICDEEGVIWSGTITTAMIAKTILASNPGKKIAYNAVCGDIVPETILGNGGEVLRLKVGHVYFKEAMKDDENIAFGGEHSGHYYFRNNWNADSGVIAFASVLDLIYEKGVSPSVLRREFEKYYAIPETNSLVDSVPGKLEELKKVYADAEIEVFDGVTFRYPDFWFNVRPSSNEPLLRLNVEANSPDLLEKKTVEILGVIRV